jgi:hypothetical protein
MHRTHSDEQAYRTFAENEYIQLICDTGLLGLIITVITLFMLLRPIRPETSRYIDVTSLGLWGALAAAATHACFEFALHLPLYLLVLVVLASLATRPSNNTPHKISRLLSRTSLHVTVILLIALAYPCFSRYTQRDSLGFISAMDAQELARYLAWAPTESHLWERLGARLPGKTDAARKIKRDCLEQAAAYNPLSASLQVELAQARLDDNDPASAAKALQRARQIRPWVHIPPSLSRAVPANP